ncbi:uncharacterized mitochondrial protein AtMg00820-like [Ricinus communis]|uniref:uncharacterized mitochondrial protein AtMg00820-like n=1 Tax=Ricinus communis TaxID=3988 RepID=UPI00201A8250|nr:uncharacterized mitochondrial protein AtMg00820-like [Ricinus communis]
MESHGGLDSYSETHSNDLPPRVHQPPSYLHDYHCYSTIVTLHEPSSYNSLWQQAMKEELQALTKTQTWDLVDLSVDKAVVGCKWVYKIKSHADGSIERYKARLVAKGFTQEYGINYEETFVQII